MRLELKDAMKLASIIDMVGSAYTNGRYVRLDVTTTRKELADWACETTGVAKVVRKKVPDGRKPQWRWRLYHRDAYEVAKQVREYLNVKGDKVDRIINHYEQER